MDLQHYFKLKYLVIDKFKFSGKKWPLIKWSISWRLMNSEKPPHEIFEAFYPLRGVSSVSVPGFSATLCFFGSFGLSLSPGSAVGSCALFHSASLICLAAVLRSRRAHPWRACRSPALFHRTQQNLWHPRRARRARRLCRLYWRWNRSEFCRTVFASASDAVWKFLSVYPPQNHRWAAAAATGEALDQLQWPVGHCRHLCGQSSQGEHGSTASQLRCSSLLQSRHVTFDLPSVFSGWCCCFGVRLLPGFPGFCSFCFFSPLWLCRWASGLWFWVDLLPVCWQDAAFILDFIRSPRSSYIFHAQVSIMSVLCVGVFLHVLLSLTLLCVCASYIRATWCLHARVTYSWLMQLRFYGSFFFAK